MLSLTFNYCILFSLILYSCLCRCYRKNNNNNNNNTPVIQVLPTPELNLLIGPVNTLYDGLEVWLRSEDRLTLCNVKKFEFHGGKFEGSNSRELLKKADQLRGLCPPNIIAKKFANASKALNDVVAVCYR